MDNLEVQIDSKEVKRLFSIMLKRGQDTSLTNQKAAILMHKRVIQNFYDEQDEEGNPWKPLSPVTLLIRRTRKKPPPTTSIGILKDTGSLRRSVRWSFTRKNATVTAGGTKQVGYAALHNFGYGVPKRQYMYIKEEDIKTIVKIYEKDLFQP